MSIEIEIMAHEATTAAGILAQYAVGGDMYTDVADRVAKALLAATTLTITRPQERPDIAPVAITRTPTVFDGTVFANTAPTAITRAPDVAPPRMHVLVVSCDEGFGPGGSEEVFFSARDGLYRVLDLLGDPVDDSLDKFSIPALEEYCDLVASKANTDGAVRWSFVPVMDARVS